MTAGFALPFPSGKILAAWWRQLAPLEPQALRVGLLLLHHVEALTRTSQHFKPDPFSFIMLRALELEARSRYLPSQELPNNHAHEHSAEAQLSRLENQLRLGRQLLTQVLWGLKRQGLVEAGPAGKWILAAPGRQALEEGYSLQIGFRRQPFYFAEQESTSTGQRILPFLSLRPGCAVTWPAGDDWNFDIKVLQSCLNQSSQWKQTRGFPLDVTSICGPEDVTALPGHPVAPPWQHVLVDRAECLAVVVARVGGEGQTRLVGFSFQSAGWTLQSAEPAFVLPQGAADDLPDFRQEPRPADWRLAWRQWCQQRGVPAADADACRLEPAGVRLMAQPGPTLLQRLESSRGKILPAEAWLLVGTGRLRTAVFIEIGSTSSGPPATPLPG
jgi:hypothetical protein